MKQDRRFQQMVATFAILAFSVSPPRAVADVIDVPVLTTRAGERMVAATPGYLTWAQNTRARPGHFDVFAKMTGGSRFKVNAAGTEGALGGIDGTTLAYQEYEFKRGLSDIKLFDLETLTKTDPPTGVNTTNWEYWPDISRPWLLFVRYRLTAYKLAIILFNLDTQEKRVLDVVSDLDYVQPGQVNGNYAVWMRWVRPGRSRIFVYDIAADTVNRIPNTRSFDWAPSVTENGTVYFGRTGRRCGSNNPRVMRYPRQGPLAVVLRLPEGVDMSDSYVSPLEDGSIQVFHNRIRCGESKTASDIYRFVDDYTVTLSISIEGLGSVTSGPPGIECGADCSHEYEPGTEVTLSPDAAEGWAFTGWSDPSCPGTDPCTLTLTEDANLTATFGSP